MIIGCDPGLKGGVAMLYNDGKLGGVWAMPSPFSISSLFKVIRSTDEPTIVWVEEPFITRGTDSRSTFTTMKNYGILIKSVQHEFGEFHEVQPSVWKSAFKLSKDKGKSMKLCLDLYPESKDRIYGSNGGAKDGLAEAILIAYYGKLWNDRQLRFKK